MEIQQSIEMSNRRAMWCFFVLDKCERWKTKELKRFRRAGDGSDSHNERSKRANTHEVRPSVCVCRGINKNNLLQSGKLVLVILYFSQKVSRQQPTGVFVHLSHSHSHSPAQQKADETVEWYLSSTRISFSSTRLDGKNFSDSTREFWRTIK